MRRDECRVIGELAAFDVGFCTCWEEVDRVHQQIIGSRTEPWGGIAGMDFHDDKAEPTLTHCRRRVR